VATQTSQTISDNEHWSKETIRHVKVLAKQKKGAKVSVNDYSQYRKRVAPVIKLPSGKTTNLPSGTTLYRMFGSFPQLLEAAGVTQGEKTTSPRKRREDMIADLQYVAKKLKLDTLSTHAYDRFREEHKTRPGKDENGKNAQVALSSSSVIRKWLGRWGMAVAQAGLKSSERTSTPKPTEVEAIDALRRAKEHCGGRLTQAAYSEFLNSLTEEERERFPTAMEIMDYFPTWQAALKVADVEQAEAIHETALYSASEIRRIVRDCETFLKAFYSDPTYQLDQPGYAIILDQSKRPMPPWDVVVDMMRV
jgi:hypothetical protein